MATVLLPRSLLALFPGVDKRHEVDGADVDAVLIALGARVPGLRDRLVEPGPRLRPHINVFVDRERAALDSALSTTSRVDVIAAISGG